MSGLTTYPWESPVSDPASALAGRFAEFVPEVETKRLRLRAPVLADFPAYAEILMSERSQPFGGPFNREEALLDFSQYVAGWLLRGCGLWAVEQRSDDALIGFVMVGMEFNDQEPELGYLFRADCEGQGFATEAAAAARDFALRELQLPVLVSYIDPGHDRSSAVAKRLGAWRDDAAAARFEEDVEVWRHAPVKGRPS